MSDGRIKLRIRVKKKQMTLDVDEPKIRSSQPKYFAIAAVAVIFVAIIFWFISKDRFDQQVLAAPQAQARFVALSESMAPRDEPLFLSANELKTNLKLRGLPEIYDESIASILEEPEKLSVIGSTSLIPEDDDSLSHADQEPPREKSDIALFSTKKPENVSTRTGYIARALLTSGVKQREPVDQLNSLVPARKEGVKRVYFYTELREMKGQTLYHHWKHAGKVYAMVPFKIKGNRWRVYSSKRLNAAMTGHWQVAVLDERGNTLHENSFHYALP